MHSESIRFDALAPGTRIGPLRLAVSAAANERYWSTVGADHPALRAGVLYPPIAANLTVLTFGRHCAEAVIQTRQRLVCHGVASAGADLVVTGEITARYEKRGRQYIDVHAKIVTAEDDAPLWTSEVTFTPAAALQSGR